MKNSHRLNLHDRNLISTLPLVVVQLLRWLCADYPFGHRYFWYRIDVSNTLKPDSVLAKRKYSIDVVSGFRDTGLSADIFNSSSGFNWLNHSDDLMFSKTEFTHSDLFRWQIDYAWWPLNINGTIMWDTYIVYGELFIFDFDNTFILLCKLVLSPK